MDCGEHAQSCDDGVCVCDEQYFTTDDDTAEATPCATKRPSKKKAILLHTLAQFGAGAFYLGWTGWGITLCVFSVLICLGCCGATAGKEDETREKGAVFAAGSLCVYVIVWTCTCAHVSSVSRVCRRLLGPVEIDRTCPRP